MTLLNALVAKYPGKEFAIEGETKIIHWPKGIGPKPTQAGINAILVEYAAGAVSRQAQADIAAGDPGLIRVIEDLIDVLIVKGLMALADLPAPVQAKLNNRKNLRTKI